MVRIRHDQGRRHRHRIRPAREQTGRRLGRAAFPDRHILRLLPYRLRPAQSPRRPGAPEVGEHQGADRQPVHPHVRTARIGDAQEQPRISDVCPRPAGRDRYLGPFPRPDQQSWHHQRTDQRRPAAGVQGRGGQQVAQGRHLRRRKGRGQMLVRTGPRRQVLAEESARRRHHHRLSRRPEGRAARRPSHPEGRRGFDRRPGSDPARLFQHRLLFRAVLGQSLRRHAPGRSPATRLRPDVVQHRSVPARLPQLPGSRGSPAESPRFLRLRRVR